MKFVFFGTPEFAAIILDKLIKADFVPQGVVCNPDRPVGRKKLITPPLVKTLASKNNILVLQPEKFDNYLITQLFNYKPDAFVVAAYAKIIPREILDIPRLGSIGIHPSLLPKYRGPSPIQAAILNGDKETGVTLFLMDEKVDNGPIISNEELVMRNENYEVLSKKLAELGADLLIKTLPKFIKGEIQPTPQNEAKATYTKKVKTEDAYVEPKDLEIAQQEGGEIAIKIERMVRALNPEPGVWTIRDNKRVKLLESKIIDEKLKITKLQFEGRKPISS